MVMFIFVGIIIIILADLFLRLVFDVVVILILTLFPAGGVLTLYSSDFFEVVFTQ